jgi:CBS domain containing-hemolysin-like protein
MADARLGGDHRRGRRHRRRTDRQGEVLASYTPNHRGDVPERGEVVEIGALKFEIIEMVGHAVEQVRVPVAA